MKKLTIKEILDKAALGVIAQGRLSKGEPGSGIDGKCFYRHPEVPGCACGVGQLIPDDNYDPGMENPSAGQLRSWTVEGLPHTTNVQTLAFALMLSGVDVDDDGVAGLLNYIQGNHDDASSVREFAQGMVALYNYHAIAPPAAVFEAAA